MATPSLRFLLLFAVAAVATAASYAGGLVALDLAGRLKAPSFANRWEFDEKMRLLREREPTRLELVFAGSSTTFYGVDPAIVEGELGTRDFFNLGVNGLKIDQTAFLLRTFLGWHPETRQVVTLSTAIDFEACPPGQSRFFNPQNLRRYLFDKQPELLFHFRYFDPVGTLRMAVALPRRRALDWNNLDSMKLGPYGGQLLDVPRSAVPPRVVRGVLGGFDPRCYRQLAELARFLDRAGVGYLFALAPMRPGYLAEYDPSGERIAAHVENIRRALAGTGARFVDLDKELAMPEEAFFDAYHLRAPWVRRQTRYLVRLLREGDSEHDTFIAGRRAAAGATRLAERNTAN